MKIHRRLFTPAVCILLSILSLYAASLGAQEHNIGYYKKLYSDGTDTTWERVWSDHFPEVADYEPQSGDVVVSWGGDDGGSTCDSGPLSDPALCPSSLSSFSATTSNSEEDPADLPEIVVTGSSVPSRSYMLAILPYRGSNGGSGDNSTIAPGEAIIRPEDLALCDTDSWQEITDEVIRRAFLTPGVLEGLRELARRSQDTGVETAGRIVIERRPASDAFAVRFEPASDFADSVSETCGSVRISASPLIDFSNSILVHTHGDWCVDDPGAVPSSQDRRALREFNFLGGLILDLANDKIISFGPDEPDEDPGEHETLCGISE